MIRCSIPAGWLEVWYGRALRLYPASFRAAYGGPMRRVFQDALADSSLSRRAVLSMVIRDLMLSVIQEQFAMMRETYSRPALLFNALVLAGISTVLGLALYAIPQQVLRLGLDDPQLQLAGDTAARLEQGDAAADTVSNVSIDMARSLAPFVIVYDEWGRPLASQARLDGGVPAPPAGVFDYVRQHGEERVSWQPVSGGVRGVRIAAVIERVGGTHPGFVLAGRSMREVENRIAQIEKMAGLAWLAMLGLVVAGTLAAGWYTRPISASAAAGSH
jgi:hypothetical protein